MKHGDRLYAGTDDSNRRNFNQAFFSALDVDKGGVSWAELNAPFAQITAYVIGFKPLDDDEDGGDGGPDAPEPSDDQPTGQTAKIAQNRAQASQTAGACTGKNPARHAVVRGSNVDILAEGVGFEPTRTVTRPTGFQDQRTRPLCEPSRQPPAMSGPCRSSRIQRPRRPTGHLIEGSASRPCDRLDGQACGWRPPAEPRDRGPPW